MGSYLSDLCKKKQYFLPQGSKEKYHVVLGQELVLALVPLRVPDQKSCTASSLANQEKALRRMIPCAFSRRNIVRKTNGIY